MRIVHASDIHFGTHLETLVESFVRTVRGLDPDLVVLSGDFTMAGRHWEFERASDLISRIGRPVLATPGNHDLPVYNLFERFLMPFRRYDRYIRSTTLDRFVGDGAVLLALNSARPWDLSLNWSHGRLSGAQIEEADRFFGQHSGAPFKGLVVHHPFYVPEDLPGFRKIARADQMLRVLAEHRVNAVFSGHLHQQSMTTRELEVDAGMHTLSLVQVASVTSTRHRDQPNAFCVLETGNEAVSVREYVARDTEFEAGQARVLLGGDAQASRDAVLEPSLPEEPLTDRIHEVDNASV